MAIFPGSAGGQSANLPDMTAIQMMVKEMRNTLPDDGLFGSTAVDMFSDLFDQEIAKRIAESGRLGLQSSLKHRLGGAEAALSGLKDGRGGARARFPVAGGVVTSHYGNRRDPFHGRMRHHRGVDIAAPQGTSIRPVRSGTVAFAGERAGYGNLVVVDHGDGLQTSYAHCEKLLVAAGQAVSGQTPIATVGDTGRATGAHLHLEARRNGDVVDPIDEFGWGER